MLQMIHASLAKAAKETALIFIGGAVSLLLGIISKIIIAHYTTTEEFGYYSLSIAVVSVFALLSTLGLHEGVARQVSVLLGGNDQCLAAIMARDAQRIGLVSGSILFLILFLLSPVIARYLFHMPQLEPLLRVISVFVPLSVLVQIKLGILRGRGIMWPQIYQGIGQSLVFLCILCLFLTLSLPFISVIYAYILSALAALFIVARPKSEDSWWDFLSFRADKGLHSPTTLLKLSLPLLVVNITGVILSWADCLILGRYTGATDVAEYSVGMTLARSLEFPLVAFAFVFMPIAGELFAKKKMNELKRTYQILTKWILIATLPLFFVFICFPELTIGALFGNRFTSSVLSLRILSFGFLSSTFWGANGVLLVALGMSRLLMKVNLFGALLNVLLNFALIKGGGYGMTGAALASMLSIGFMNITASALIYKETSIHPLSASYLRSIAVSSVMLVLFIIFAHYLPKTTWLLPFYFISIVVVLFASLLFSRSLDKEDFLLLESVMIKAGIPLNLINYVIHRPSR